MPLASFPSPRLAFPCLAFPFSRFLLVVVIIPHKLQMWLRMLTLHLWPKSECDTHARSKHSNNG